MGALAPSRGEGTAQQTLEPFPRGHRRPGGVVVPGGAARAGHGRSGHTVESRECSWRWAERSLKRRRRGAPIPPRERTAAGQPVVQVSALVARSAGPSCCLRSPRSRLRVNFLPRAEPISAAGYASPGSALTRTPCDRLPSAISGAKVRPLLVSALDSRSSVPRLPVPHPPGRPTCSPRALPPPPPGTRPGALGGEGQVPVPGRGSAERGSAEPRGDGGGGGAGVTKSQRPPRPRRHRRSTRSLSGGSAPSVAPRGPARRPGPGLGRGGSPEPGAPMRRLAAAAAAVRPL